MLSVLTELSHNAPGLSLVARAGGGGSGSGGGGGSLIILIGYVPMHFIGAALRKLKAKHTVEFDIFQFGGWLIAILYTVLLIVVLHGIGVIAGFGGLIGMGAGLYGWFGKLKQNKQTKQALQAAASHDRAWDEATLLSTAQTIFMRYQADWTTGNMTSMQTYMTPWYHYHASLMVHALQLASRRDEVGNPTIQQALIVEVHDNPGDGQDEVVVGFTASANDRLIDTRDNTTLFVDKKPFTEFWRFRRAGDTWLLDGIQQATASHWTYRPDLEAFAAQHKYCFSLDWGWLLLPRRGQLFGGGKFGVSDINNHIIGVHNQSLVQLYSYQPNPKQNRIYLIAQTNLPKAYGDIVVRHRSGWHPFGIRGLKDVSTEWPDFNKKFQVFATSPEQATSLELLNPSFMQKLEALPFEVNIEVVDNVVYLYSPQTVLIVASQYEDMLNLLDDAFKEMRL